MAKYDLEALMTDIGNLMVNGFNDAILAVSADKNDGLVLKPVDPNALYFETLNQSEIVFDPFVLYAIEKIGTDAMPGVVAENTTISVVLVLADQGTDTKIVTKLLRYGRALKELFLGSRGKIGNGVTLKIESLEPVQWRMTNDSNTFRAIGVSISANVAG